jgi:hypothetical protein
MSYRRPSFWIALSLIALSAVAVFIVYLRIARIPFFFVNILGVINSPVHWLEWAGALIILATTTTYSLRKRVLGQASGRLLKIHSFGNLIRFLLICARAPDPLPATLCLGLA